MQVTCPKCKKTINLPQKIETAIKKLEPGKGIGIKCPHCSQPMPLDKTMLPRSAPPASAPGKSSGGKTPKVTVKPPAAPDLSWLDTGFFEDEEAVEDIPQALILMEDGPESASVVEAIEGIGYHAEVAHSTQEAIDKMKFISYAGVILHSRFCCKDLDSNSFHQYMRAMAMKKRRYIFYILIGPEFQTLYDLQALSVSANLVINEKQVDKLDIILRKAIPMYEELFGPLMEELSAHGL